MNLTSTYEGAQVWLVPGLEPRSFPPTKDVIDEAAEWLKEESRVNTFEISNEC